MKISTIFILTILMSYSCSSDKSENKELNAQEISYPKALALILDEFTIVHDDFLLNKEFFKDSLKNSNKFLLSLKQVKFLASNLGQDKYTENGAYNLNAFYKIANSKLNNSYSDYVSKLDIAMMQDATCFALNRMEFGDSVSLLIWKMNYESYPACPFYSGTNYFGTLISNSKIVETILIASDENAGDAPMVSDVIQEVKITKNGLISCNYESIVFEEEEEIEHINESFKYQISKQGFLKYSN